MNKVHVVWRREDEEYFIDKIFSTEEAADKYVIENNQRWYRLHTDDYEVED